MVWCYRVVKLRLSARLVQPVPVYEGHRLGTPRVAEQLGQEDLEVFRVHYVPRCLGAPSEGGLIEGRLMSVRAPFVVEVEGGGVLRPPVDVALLYIPYGE